MDLRERLIAFLKQQDIPIEEVTSTEDASLIRSGLLDSLALFNLAIWIEQEVGHPFDLTVLDLAQGWDTLTGIVEFVKTSKGEVIQSNGQADHVPETHVEWDTKS